VDLALLFLPSGPISRLLPPMGLIASPSRPLSRFLPATDLATSPGSAISRPLLPMGLIVSLEMMTISPEGGGFFDVSPKYGHVQGGGSAICPSVVPFSWHIFFSRVVESSSILRQDDCSWKLKDRFLGAFGEPSA
jgi:hypothetical protein